LLCNLSPFKKKNAINKKILKNTTPFSFIFSLFLSNIYSQETLNYKTKKKNKRRRSATYRVYGNTTLSSLIFSLIFSLFLSNIYSQETLNYKTKKYKRRRRSTTYTGCL